MPTGNYRCDICRFMTPHPEYCWHCVAWTPHTKLRDTPVETRSPEQMKAVEIAMKKASRRASKLLAEIIGET